MTVAELIEKLMEIPEEKRKTMPVCLVNWNEGTLDPANGMDVERLSVERGEYFDSNGQDLVGEFLQIG